MPIAAVSAALRDLAAGACSGLVADDAVIIRQMAEVPFLQGDGVAVILLRADANTSQRQRPVNGGRADAFLPLTLHYAVVPYAMEALVQHRLLARLMRAAAENGVLSVAGLNGPIQIIIDTPQSLPNDPTAGWPACLHLRIVGAVIEG